MSLRTIIGVSVTNNETENNRQIEGLRKILDDPEPQDIIMVGNELSLANVDLEIFLKNIDLVRDAVLQKGLEIPIGTVEIYGGGIDHEALEKLDIIGINAYPAVWDSTEYSVAAKKLDEYFKTGKEQFSEKAVLLTETGAAYAGGKYWVENGRVKKESPSKETATSYLEGFLQWSKKKEIPSFYFQAFLQPAKSFGEGHPMEQYFGLIDGETM